MAGEGGPEAAGAEGEGGRHRTPPPPPPPWLRWCGRDPAGARVLLVTGCRFVAADEPSAAEAAAKVEAALRDRGGGADVDVDLGAVQPFVVVYEHAGVSLWSNSPGVMWLRDVWSALSEPARGAMGRCYMLHMSLDLRLGTGLFAPAGAWPRMLHVDRVRDLWGHLERRDARLALAAETYAHETTLGVQPLYDYGIGIPQSIPEGLLALFEYAGLESALDGPGRCM